MLCSDSLAFGASQVWPPHPVGKDGKEYRVGGFGDVFIDERDGVPADEKWKFIIQVSEATFALPSGQTPFRGLLFFVTRFAGQTRDQPLKHMLLQTKLGNGTTGFYVLGSADGLRWRQLYNDSSWAENDTMDVVMWNSRLGKYVKLTRTWTMVPTEGPGSRPCTFCVGQSTT